MAIFRRKLWVYLTAIYALTGTVGTMSVLVIMDTVISYRNFQSLMSEAAIRNQIGGEFTGLRVTSLSGDALQPLFARITRSVEALGLADGSDYYYLTSSSDPAVSFEVLDPQAGSVLASPPSAAAGGRDAISVSYPLAGADGTPLGLLLVRVSARFDVLKQLGHSLGWIMRSIAMFVAISAAVGSLCGFIASRGLIRRLDHVTDVSKTWSMGDFSARIHDPRGDELSEHALHLNDMASQLSELLEVRERSAVLDERTRMARDLHDTVKQNLFALSLQLAALKSMPGWTQGALASLEECRLILHETQLQLVQVIDELRPLGLERIDLSELITKLCADIERNFKVTIRRAIEPEISASAASGTQVERIAREAISNAVRHTGGADVAVALRTAGGRHHLTVGDRGGGFEAERPPAGRGIPSMRERAQDLAGGEFSIRSSAGKGTLVTLSWQEDA